MREALVLAIEAAIAGGSLSLLRSGNEIASFIGTGPPASAESLLPNIDRLLTENGITRDELGLVAVSAGPGSYTGIRVGLATALGLKTGLGIRMASVSTLLAIASNRDRDERCVVALPAGRGSVCIQRFDVKPGRAAEIDRPDLVSFDEFESLCSTARGPDVFLVHGSLFEALPAELPAVDLGWNLARPIGLYCTKVPNAMTAPLFVRKKV